MPSALASAGRADGLGHLACRRDQAIHVVFVDLDEAIGATRLPFDDGAEHSGVEVSPAVLQELDSGARDAEVPAISAEQPPIDVAEWGVNRPLAADWAQVQCTGSGIGVDPLDGVRRLTAG